MKKLFIILAIIFAIPLLAGADCTNVGRIESINGLRTVVLRCEGDGSSLTYTLSENQKDKLGGRYLGEIEITDTGTCSSVTVDVDNSRGLPIIDAAAMDYTAPIAGFDTLGFYPVLDDTWTLTITNPGSSCLLDVRIKLLPE